MGEADGEALGVDDGEADGEALGVDVGEALGVDDGEADGEALDEVGACVPQSFSYHANVSSSQDAESKSTSPSPSTSVAKTERAPSASVVMIRSVNDWDPSFSYHATVSIA